MYQSRGNYVKQIVENDCDEKNSSSDEDDSPIRKCNKSVPIMDYNPPSSEYPFNEKSISPVKNEWINIDWKLNNDYII